MAQATLDTQFLPPFRRVSNRCENLLTLCPLLRGIEERNRVSRRNSVSLCVFTGGSTLHIPHCSKVHFQQVY
jgi:hypothetical protein